MSVPRIMIVEDMATISLYAKKILLNKGFDVVAVVKSGEEAILKAEELKPDLILMDILLEGDMDGIETTHIIHRNNRIPILYMTGGTEEEYLERALETAPYGYIFKPFDSISLYTVVRNAIHKHELEQRLRQEERRFKLTIEGLSCGLVYAKVIWNENKLIEDLQILEINKYLLSMFGLERSHLMYQSYIGFMSFFHNYFSGWKNIYKKILINKKQMKVLYFDSKYRTRFSIKAFSPEEDYLVFLIEDLNREEELNRNLKVNDAREEKIQSSTQNVRDGLTLSDYHNSRGMNFDFQNLSSAINYVLIGISASERINYWNKTAEQLFGLDEDAVLGRKFYSLSIQWRWEEIFQGIADSYIEGRFIDLPLLTLRTKQGKEIKLELCLNPVRDDQGQIQGCLILGREAANSGKGGS